MDPNKTLTAIKQKSRFLTGSSSPAVVKRPRQLMCDMKWKQSGQISIVLTLKEMKWHPTKNLSNLGVIMALFILTLLSQAS